jgi:hypothetical protein
MPHQGGARGRVGRWFSVLFGASALTLALTVPAAAHPVGTAGEPNCLGQRISHGANHSPIQEGHALTPVERWKLAEEYFGVEIPTLGDWIKFVKTCPPPPDLD